MSTLEIVIAFIIILGIIAFKFNTFVRKSFFEIILIFLFVSGFGFFHNNILTEYFLNGYLGFSFYVIVMYAGAFKKGSLLYKRFFSVRKEYSILGFISLLPHFITYFLDYLNGSYPWEYFGVIAAFLMVPLFIISFRIIRSKMSFKVWKNMQRFSYIIYFLIFMHLFLISEYDHRILYIVIFSFYIILKTNNYILVHKPLTAKFTIFLILLMSVLESMYIINVNSDLNTSNNVINVDSLTFKDGVFEGTSTGYKGLPIDLYVTIDNGLITDINIIDYGSTAPNHGVNYVAVANSIANNVIASQSTDIDSFSGATHTSYGILDAITKAINKAKIT